MLISVIIPTKNRPETVPGTVQSILDGRHQDFEIRVIDQSPDDTTLDALRPQLADPRVVYLRERRPGYGAASARNLGIVSAVSDVLAVTDDDVSAQPDWLERIDAAFSVDRDLDFIAGRLTAPPYDATEGFVPSFDADPTLQGDRRLPLRVSGANFSFRRRLVERIGGYDEFSGPGSRLRASEDTDFCFRVVHSGTRLRVDPSIEVVHEHGFRPQSDALALHSRYNFGNGGNYGRFTRRGHLSAGAWFMAREVRSLARDLRRNPRAGLQASRQRLAGFAAGLRWRRSDGFVSGPEMARRHALVISARSADG